MQNQRVTPIISIFIFVLFLALITQSVTAAKPLAKIIVEAGKYTRIDTPVSISLSDIPDLPSDSALRLEEIKSHDRLPVPSQIEPGNPPRLWWILSGATPAGAERVYELVKANSVKDPAFTRALENGQLANEGFARCRCFVEGWLEQADPKTGLIPRNLGKKKDIWNAKDSAADNYPFMVLTAAITDQPLFNGRMLDMLRTETKLTSRIGKLPDTYSFSKQDFQDAKPNMDRIMFGASEYIKDGLLPLTEWLGPSPWCDRMLGMLDDMWKYAPIETKYGKIVSTNQEINGEMLQTLSRIYWMTGEKKYLEWAVRLGDYYLLGEHHPTRNTNRLSLDDHGCEIISGLCELYATVHFVMPDKKRAYQEPIHEMLDRILQIGRHEHGLFYNRINPQTGQHAGDLTDNWGYDLNGFYTVYLIDKTEAYRQAVRNALGNLHQHYSDYKWEGGGADGYADSIEGGINLYNREPIPAATKWLDSQTRIMWNIQKPDGVIEGWHGDGNFARTTIMYCLWKTKGTTIQPWRKDVVFGAVQDGNLIKISIRAEKDWQGKILFDSPRHKTIMKMPLDWPRINQFPEWFTVKNEKRYAVNNLTSDSQATYTGKQMREGITICLQPGIEQRLLVQVQVQEPELAAPAVEVIKKDSFLQIQAGGNKVLRYSHALVPPPEGTSPLYARSGFIHPLWSPAGTILTNIHPPDHIHHFGIWMPWTKTKFEGKEVDFWNLGKGEGTVRFGKFLFTATGPVCSGFQAEQEHVALKTARGEKVVLNETWNVRVYNIGGPEKGYWLWDLTSTQRCDTDSPLYLPEYRYGGLAFRGLQKWQGENISFLTSEGKTRKDGHATRARWCDISGLTDKDWAGVTIMSHPENYRHPQPLRIHPKIPYFNFAPSQLGDWTIEPGKDYIFRYRFYVHDGKINVANAECLWYDFADPPKVKLQKISKKKDKSGEKQQNQKDKCADPQGFYEGLNSRRCRAGDAGPYHDGRTVFPDAACKR